MIRLVARCLVVASLLCSAAFVQAQSVGQLAEECTSATVPTKSGDVCGVLVEAEGRLVAAYLGVPYGEDTGGTNRFAPPVPRAPWDGVLSAVRPGDACPQVRLQVAEGGPAQPQSEDCLFLNVWTPAEAPAAPLPVLVFIHGGGFLVGTATDSLASEDVDWYNIDGRFLAAEQRLVVVSMNYRLGAFGFLGGLDGFSGNYGILDQQLALRWVKENVAQFGGNPDQVTIVGESAGATAVAVHLFAAPGSAELFDRAIMESNPAGVGIYDQDQARAQAERFLRSAGCLVTLTRLSCLQSKSIEQLIEAQAPDISLLSLADRGVNTLLAWLPTVDGEVVTRQPLLAALDGASDKAFLIGNNDDEAFSFLGRFVTEDVNPLIGAALYEILFGDKVADMVQRDYVDGAADTATALLSGVGDYMFMCPAELTALASERGYHYRFSHPPEYSGGLTGGITCGERTCHAVELPYVFGTGRFPGGFSEADRAVSDQMMSLWSAFARGEADIGAAFRGWPAAVTADGTANTLVISSASAVEPFPSQRCAPWGEHYRQSLR